MKFATSLLCGIMALGLTAAHADGLSRGEAADLGFDPDHLNALDEAISTRIVRGEFPGAVIMVARDGQIAHLSALGLRTQSGAPMSEDSIFRIYSMTKPVTSVVAMMLIEEGKLDLLHPISAYLPEYGNMVVMTTDGEEPASRPILVQDLLMHTAGITYGFFGEGAARAAMATANLENGGFSNREVARKIGALPLEHQPGTVWEYGRSTDVLGALIEVVERKPLGEVFQERIFGPLGMSDTGFWADEADERERLAEPNADDQNIGSVTMFDPTQERAFQSAGGGLISTIGDYARFSQMLLNGGELNGARILSPATVDFMMANHLGPRGIKPGKYDIMGPGYSFSLGGAVRTDAGAPVIGSADEFYWGGAAGTYFWLDPEQEMFAIYMMQSPRHGPAVSAQLRNMIYGAMTD